MKKIDFFTRLECLGGKITNYLFGTAIATILLLTTECIKAQTIYTWANGGAGGAWNVSTNWEPNGIPTTGDIIYFFPTVSFTITNVPAISVNSMTEWCVTPSVLTFTAASQGTVLTIINSMTVERLTTATVTGAGIAAGSNLSFDFGPGSFYNHSIDGGAIPTASWDASSTCYFNYIITTPPTNLNQTFGNFTWNCNQQSVAVDMGYTANATVTKGNFTIMNTTSGSLSLTTYNISPITLMISGDLIIQGGNLLLNNGGGGIGHTINLCGNYNQSGGTLGSTNSSTLNFSGSGKTYTQAGGSVTNTNINYAINTAGASLTLNNSNISIGAGRNFTVTSGTLYIPNGYNINGGGTFTLASNNAATLGIGDLNGITSGTSATGNIQVTGGRSFGTAANYIYYGTAPSQTTGNGLPAAVNNLTINNTSTGVNDFGVVMTSSLTVNGTLTLMTSSASNIPSLTVDKMGALTLTLNGKVSGTGTIYYGYSGNLSLGYTGGGCIGTINFFGGVGILGTLIVNITGTNSSVNINNTLIMGTSFSLQSGVVNMGNNIAAYTGSGAGPMQSSGYLSSYFSFLGETGGFQWNMVSIGAGTYRWPIGPAGTATGFRPVTITTGATYTSNVRIGFINATDGSGIYSACDIPAAGGNQFANYTANVIVTATIGSPNITMEYQNLDFYGGAPTAGNVKIWYYNTGTTSKWTSTGAQTSNSTDGSNITIAKSAAIGLTSKGTYPLNLAQTNNDPGNATWVWTAGAGTTSWNTGGNWNPASVPNSATANVVINNAALTNFPSMDMSASVKNIFIGFGCSFSLNTYTLAISGAFSNYGIFNAGTGTINYQGTSQTIIPLNYYNLDMAGATSPILSPDGIIGISNTFNRGAAMYTYAGSTITFNGTAAQNVPNFAYFNDVNFNSAVSNTLAGAIRIYGNMTINTPIFNDGGYTVTSNGGGTLTLSPTSAYNIGSVSSGSTIPAFGAYVLSTGSTVNYMSSLAQTIASSPVYSNLSTGGAMIKTAGGNLSVGGNLSILAGTFADGGYAVSGTTGHSLTVSAGGGYMTSRTVTPWFPTGMTTYTLDAASTLTYAGAGSYTMPVSPNNYGNLVIQTGAIANTVTFPPGITVSGNINVMTGTLADGGNTVTGTGGKTFTVSAGAAYTTSMYYGSWFPTNITTFSLDPASTVNYNGTGSFALPANPAAYGNINMSSSVSISGSITVNGNLTLTGDLTTQKNSMTFTNTATNPNELNSGMIYGTAIMNARSAGSSAFPTFLGVAMASGGNDIGTLSLTRTNSPISGGGLPHQSIIENWKLGIGQNTLAGKTITFSWLSILDYPDACSAIVNAQLYYSADGSTNWTAVGNAISVSGSNLRQITVTVPPAVTASTTYWTVVETALPPAKLYSICGDSVMLHAPGCSNYSWSPATGLSSTSISNPIANPTVTTTYAVSSQIGNLIVNGDFEKGYYGFSTDYFYQSALGALNAEGGFDLFFNASYCNGFFSTCSDHTSGTGNMMIINGSTSGTATLWSQTVSVYPNTDYTFSMWSTSVYPGEPPVLNITINGQQLGTFNVNANACQWQEFTASWNSQSDAIATITIVDQNTSSIGNDFAIDDISLLPLNLVTDTVIVNVKGAPLIFDTIPNQVVCAGNPITFNLNATGLNLSYQWTKGGNDIPGATTSSYTISNAKSTDEDFYSCTITNACGSNPIPQFILTVRAAPNPNNIYVIQAKQKGDSVTYSLSPGGTAPFRFQWQRNGVNIAGATKGDLTLDPVMCGDTGIYSCSIANACDSVITKVVNLYVLDCIRYKHAISGFVKYDNTDSTIMPNVEVYIKNSSDMLLDSIKTDANGFYIFNNLVNDDYKLSCSTKKAWGGGNPVDALMVNRNYIGLYNITDPLKKLAANVSNDTKINPVDALMINRRYIGILHKFNISDWLFSNPAITMSNVDESKNIIAICAGDVNGSYIPPAERIWYKSVNQSGAINVSAGTAFEIPVYLDDNRELGAIGIKLKSESSMFKVTGIRTNIEGLIYKVDYGQTTKDCGISLAWAAEAEGFNVNPERALFFIRAICTEETGTSSFGISSESVLADIDVNNISPEKLVMPGLKYSREGRTFSIENYPNPFNNLTRIEYNIPEDAAVKISIYNVLGQGTGVLKDKEEAAGTHSLQFDASRLREGIYYCVLRLKTKDAELSKTNIMTIIR